MNTRNNQFISIVLVASIIGISLIGCALPNNEANDSSIIETALSETSAIETITIGMSSDDLTRLNYREAVDYLSNHGFSNVTAVAVGDIMFNTDYEVDSVSSIEINEVSSFSATDAFEFNSQIYVYYHSTADIEAGTPDMYIGEDCNDVIESLQTIGFSNIQLSEYPDLIFGYLHFEGEVNGIEINGLSDFDDDSVFPSGALVVVSYHTFADEEETPSVDLEILSFEEFVDHLDGVLQVTFGDNHTIEIQENNTIVVSTWSDGISDIYSQAEAGDMDQFDEWNQLKTEVQSLCEEVIDCFAYVEVEDPHLTWNVLDETDNEVVLLIFSDTEFTYDAVPTPTPTNTPTPTPTNTPTPTPTNTPTPTPTPTPVPETTFAFRKVHPEYTQYYIIDTVAHTATYFVSNDSFVQVFTYSGDITSQQVACYYEGELWFHLQISSTGHSMTEIDDMGFDWMYYYCSVEDAEAALANLN